MPNEEYAIVLDYMAQGKATSFKKEPLAQLIGENHFTLLEVVPKAQLKIGERIYVGQDERDKIDYIKRRIKFSELSSTGVAELEKTIEKIIMDQRERFLDFYNSSTPITLRRHQLELLPGLGKKHLMDLLKERETRKFDSFDEIEKRVKLMPNPLRLLVKRIVEELQDEDLKHYIFARPPARERPQFRR